MTVMKRIGLMVALMAAGALFAAPPPVKKGPLIGARPAVKTVPRAAVKAKPAPKKTTASKPAGLGAGPMAPYRGAIALDADTGRVLAADHAERTAYPASVTKLMTFLLVLEDVKAGRYALGDRVAGSVYSENMEPSRVGLLSGQTMTVEDLLYAIMIKSANDGAAALAEHAAWIGSGGKGPVPPTAQSRALVQAFVARMNRRAKELGMTSTRYESPNGLPPARGEARGFDTSTAADIAKLCRRIVAFGNAALRYTSSATKTVTGGDGKPLTLATHNYFLPGSHDKDGHAHPVPGCDGLKTGYTVASGSSIALTAAHGGRRVIVVVLGSAGRHEREAAAGRLLRDALGAVSMW